MQQHDGWFQHLGMKLHTSLIAHQTTGRGCAALGRITTEARPVPGRARQTCKGKRGLTLPEDCRQERVVSRKRVAHMGLVWPVWHGEKGWRRATTGSRALNSTPVSVVYLLCALG